MNILITGASGFIGQSLSEELKSQGLNLFFTTRKENAGANFINTEISDIPTLTNFLSENKIDGIIHLASLFLVGHTHANVKDLIDSNITFPTKLVEAAASAKTKWFLNTGTFWQHLNNEDYNPVNLYAATKQAFEDIIKFYAETSSVKFLTLELSDTFGPNDSRAKIFNKWVNVTSESPAMDMSPGDQEIDILYISDVVNAYVSAIDLLKNKTSSIPEKYSLASGEVYSLKNLSKAFSEIFKKELKINWGKLPYRPREVMQTWKRGKALPGWKPKFSFKEGCEEIRKK